MSDKTTQKESKPLGLSRPGRLELRKTVEGGQVRQSFSHGRSKTVQVEVKKKRTFKRGSSGSMTEVTADATTAAAEALATASEQVSDSKAGHLTDTERAARLRALEGARHAETELAAREAIEAEERRRAEAERRKAKEAERKAAEAEAERKAKEDEAARLRDQAASKALAGAAKAKTKAATPAPAAERTKSGGRKAGVDDDKSGSDSDDRTRRKRGDANRLSIGRRNEPRRRAGKMTVVQAFSDEERQRSLASVRRAREREKRAAKESQPVDTRRVVREVVVPEAITVQELANRMAVRGAEVVKTLMKMGVMATINQVIDTDTAELVVSEFGHKAKRVSAADVEIGLTGHDDDPKSLRPRAPVVTVMGHVDHGKTSLLDALRATDVAGGEAGGITQHIGAYQVKMPSGAQITFLDTPGHEAFTQMRRRGARATDIVVLVVAADDGVMPQTVEAIQHAQAAEVPLIVAINKIDRPEANADRVRNELLQHNVVLESVGGDVISVEVSAKERLNLDKLEEAVLLQAELMELTANPNRPAEGIVVESQRDRGRGVVTTVLVQRGTLKVGNIVVAGSAWGRARALVDDKGRNLNSAGPSQPIEVLGLNDTPVAGDEVVVVEDESRAREVTEYRQEQLRGEQAAAAARGSIEQMMSQIQQGEVNELAVLVKADVHGSLEAILASLHKLATDEVSVRVLLSGVGGINESDISLAATSNALVIGFNVRADAPARNLARRDGVEIRYYSIIYELLDDLRGLMSGLLAPTIKETTLGYARIKEVFNVSKVGRVAGCEVTEGNVKRGANVRLLRDNVVIFDGAMSNLRRHKDDVAEVKEGTECGIALENYHDLKEGDVLEVYQVQEVARSLDG